MNQIIDNAIALRLVYLMAQKITETDAFKLGIVDENGKQLKNPLDLKTTEEKNAYSYLQRFIFKIKVLLGKMGQSAFPAVGVALAMLKEDVNIDDIDEQYLTKMIKMYEDSPVTGVSQAAGVRPGDEAFKTTTSSPVLAYVTRNKKDTVEMNKKTNMMKRNKNVDSIA